jgi:NAD(P)-dependent dehydrogenase (short-subunit alcohol dehydrogenase family)
MNGPLAGKAVLVVGAGSGIGTGAEVGAAVSFLLSDRASHISGVVLPVDGGFLA